MDAKSPLEKVFEDRKTIIEKRERDFLLRSRQFLSVQKPNV
jgi:hypothetical protein